LERAESELTVAERTAGMPSMEEIAGMSPREALGLRANPTVTSEQGER